MTTPAQIVDMLRNASHAYYNGTPLMMDDDTYDSLVEKLKEVDSENPYLEEVGAPPTDGVVKLPYAMPSLDKIKPGQEQLQRFLRNTGFVLSEKLDGLSALWIPATGRLLLRGNGLVGQDISHLVSLGIQGLSKACPLNMATRGELILPRSDGQALGRSWVNGQIHQLHPIATEISKIHFVAYEILGTEMKRSQQFTMLHTCGFELPWWRIADTVTELELMEALQARRRDSPYDTDGLVIGLNGVPKSESTTSKAKNPKDCVAFKMPLEEQSAETVVQEVLWAPSAQGYLIPRIRFTPVKIGAATIEFCTGHNARMIYTNKIGPGARVIIRRSGDVIPKLDRVLVATTSSFPSSDTWVWDGDADTAAHIKAVGTNAASISAKLYYFLKTLEIPGAGPATATALVEAGITGPAALWGSTAATLSKILGPKTGSNLYNNLRLFLAKVDEATLMHASSVMPRGVGDTKLTSLFAVEKDPRKWPTTTAPTGWTQESFAAFLSEFPTYMAWRTQELHWIPYPILKAVAAPPVITGETICMTGFRDKSIEETGTHRGHAFVPTFTGKVTILLVPDGPRKESDKVKSAQAKGVKILSRSQFIAEYLS